MVPDFGGERVSGCVGVYAPGLALIFSLCEGLIYLNVFSALGISS